MSTKLTPEELAALKKGENPCRVLRTMRGELTQQKLAEMLGMNAADKSYVSRLERGEFVGSLAVWRDICQLFNASLDDIAPYVRHDRRRFNHEK